MPDAPPKDKDASFDVVMLAGKTDDGGGTKVLRARPGKLEAGEVRPMTSGKPLMAGGDVVSLTQRQDAPALYDVKVEHTIESPRGASAAETRGVGPAQVATDAYRDSWERTFGARETGALN